MSVQSNETNIANELIEKAIEIFSVKGYLATNLTDITDALGVSRGPVYYHFKDKYGLYKAAYEIFEHEVRSGHDRIFAKEQHIIKYVEEIIYNCIELNKRFGKNFLFGLDSIEELASINEKYLKLSQDIYQQKIEKVQKAIEKGEMRRSINPKLIVDSIYVLYLGIVNGMYPPIKVDFNEGEINNLISVLLLGIERYCCD